MYIKKSIKEEISALDEYLKKTPMPKYWRKYINEQKEYLILKDKKDYQCLYCNHIFKSARKVDEYEKCPKCKKKSLIKSNRLTRWVNKKSLSLVMPYEKDLNQIVIRSYELYIQYQDRKMSFILTEWNRCVTDKLCCTRTEYTANLKSNMGCRYVYHWNNESIWIPSQYRFGFIDNYYYYNLNEIFDYKYYDLNLLANKKDIDLKDISYAAYQQNRCLELFIKSGLYNLTEALGDFKETGSFKDIFGIDISYLPFMQENDITYKQLEMLIDYKIKDIKMLDWLSERKHNIRELERYIKVDIFKLYDYQIPNGMIYEYLDYIKFASELKYDLNDKKILYPENIKEKHDELLNLIKIKKDKKISTAIKKRSKILNKNIYQDKKFIIFPAETMESLIDESKQNRNCVKTYAEAYAKGRCDIYFMRLIKDTSKSLVTVEVKDNKVIQQRIKNNGPTSLDHKRFLNKWQSEVLESGE